MEGPLIASTRRPFVWGHRPALTQLRFVAVTLVLAFHAGMLDQGYIGVDVFFVLSGFLISNLLWEASTGDASMRASLATFWVRRVRRLLPLATFVLATTTIATWAWFDTTVDDFSSSVRSSALWFQNWNLASQQADYFAPDGTNPLTHYWSLSIEEQFYLLFPLLMLGSLRLLRGREKRVRLAAVLGIAGLGISFSVLANVRFEGTEIEQYYATHTRAYQLFAGMALMAIVRLWPPRRSPRVFVGSLLAVVAIAAWSTGSVFQTGLFATVASVFVIGSGQTLRRRAPKLELLGDLSYGVYLWHFPINEYLRNEVRGYTPIMIFGLTFVLAHALSYVTYRLIETRVARARPALPRRVFAAAAVVIVFILSIPSVVTLDRAKEVVQVIPVIATTTSTSATTSTTSPSNGSSAIPTTSTSTSSTTTTLPPDTYTGRLHEEYVSVPVEGTSVFRCGARDPRASCIDVAGDTKVLLLGDSFAEQFYPALHTLAIEQHWEFSTFLRRGCPWQTDVFQDLRNSFSEPCRRSKATFDPVVDALAPEVVLLHNFPYFTNEPEHMTSAASGQKISTDAFIANSLDTIAALNDRGADVIAIESTPTPASGKSVVTCVRANDHRAAGCEFTYAHFDDGFDAALKQHATTNPLFSYVSINDWYCDGAECRAGYRGDLVMSDVTHTSSSMLLEERNTLLDRLVATGAFD